MRCPRRSSQTLHAENRVAPAFVYAGTIRASALVFTREMGETDLSGPRTDAEARILASARAGVDRPYRLGRPAAG